MAAGVATAIIGIGTDLVSHARILDLCRRRTAARLARRICHPRELADLAQIEAAAAARVAPAAADVLAQQARFLATRYGAPPRRLGSSADGAR